MLTRVPPEVVRGRGRSMSTTWVALAKRALGPGVMVVLGRGGMAPPAGGEVVVAEAMKHERFTQVDLRLRASRRSRGIQTEVDARGIAYAS